MFLDEGVSAPARDVGGQRGGAVEDGFPCVPEVFAAVVEVDHVDGVVAFLAGKQTKSFTAPPVLGELGVFGAVIRQLTEFNWLAQTDAPLHRNVGRGGVAGLLLYCIGWTDHRCDR